MQCFVIEFYNRNICSRSKESTDKLFSANMNALRQINQIQIAAEAEEQVHRLFRERKTYAEFNDEELRSRFRFSRASLNELLRLLSGHIPNHSGRSFALSKQQRLLLCLRVLASGSFLEVIGDHFGVHKSTASRSFWEVISAILEIVPQYISTRYFNTHRNLQWFDNKSLPGIVGFVDGTHILIEAPERFEYEFINRKGFHSINTQIVCTGEMLIADCVALWPGSTHDSRILNESSLRTRFENNSLGKIIYIFNK